MLVDRTNLCIQVFSNEGVFLRSFDCDRNKVKLFKEPAIVYVYLVNMCLSPLGTMRRIVCLYSLWLVIM